MPARLTAGEESLQELVEFPDVAEDMIVNVNCRAQINSKGRMKQQFCFRSAQVQQSFRDAIDKAAKSARWTPAMVDGEPQRVTVFYRVMFARKDGRSVVRVYSNWARDLDRFGNDYVGPQRITRLNMPRACSTRVQVVTGPSDSLQRGSDGPSIFLIALLRIDESGAPVGEIEFESASNVDDSRCRTHISEQLTAAEYIPGHHDGVPVEVTYVQPVGVYEDMELRR